MPAKDFYHDLVKKALSKAGWTVTHDPYRIEFGPKDVYVDLGAERIIAAEKGQEKVAVEIKSFLSESEIHYFEMALGQYVFYHSLLTRSDPERKLFFLCQKRFMRPFSESPLLGLSLKTLG